MYNYADPSDMSRYSSGSMAYFPTSTDPTMGGAMPSRDHTSSSYQAASDHTKFPRGGADIGTAVAVSSTQQNQQGISDKIMVYFDLAMPYRCTCTSLHLVWYVCYIADTWLSLGRRLATVCFIAPRHFSSRARAGATATAAW